MKSFYFVFNAHQSEHPSESINYEIIFFVSSIHEYLLIIKKLIFSEWFGSSDNGGQLSQKEEECFVGFLAIKI